MMFGTIAAAVVLAGCVSGPKVDNTPVSALDLNRYLGEWYEIARFDHSFERGVEQAKANYTQNADGTIKVVNSGIKNGKPKTAIGKGKTTDTPGLLRVSFFGPFYADYRVMLIDKEYTYALVGSGSADYLWLLSRTPELSETAKSELLAEIAVQVKRRHRRIVNFQSARAPRREGEGCDEDHSCNWFHGLLLSVGVPVTGLT